MSEEVRHLLLRLATAHRSRDIANTRALIKECDGLLRRRGPAQTALQQARDAAQQWLLERNGELSRGRNAQLVSQKGNAAVREQKKRDRQAKQAAARRQGYMAELQPALDPLRGG
ncbi:hypothetical protein [Streptomyces kaempferi]|uniref:Uncharacterized protein n=1 Tax=Streptomyces kaempferi TaxID=333725 RepID=A0ABW3XW22_9ACTN